MSIKQKEINSDLFYKISTTNDIPFSYERNGNQLRENRTVLKVKPGDWVNINYEGELEFEERKLLNYLFKFIIKRKSLFSLIFQASLLVGYFGVYAFMIFDLQSKGAWNAAFTYVFKDLILFLPLVTIFYKMIKTGYRSFSIIGPSSSLKKRFSNSSAIKFIDASGKIRKINLDINGKMLEDQKGIYYYRDSEKVTTDVYKFDFLIVNKNPKPLYNLEYYTIQLNFKQKEGLLITNGKKIEYSKIEIINNK